MAPPSMLEEVLHRDRGIVVAALLSVVSAQDRWAWFIHKKIEFNTKSPLV